MKIIATVDHRYFALSDEPANIQFSRSTYHIAMDDKVYTVALNIIERLANSLLNLCHSSYFAWRSPFAGKIFHIITWKPISLPEDPLLADQHIIATINNNISTALAPSITDSSATTTTQTQLSQSKNTTSPTTPSNKNKNKNKKNKNRFESIPLSDPRFGFMSATQNNTSPNSNTSAIGRSNKQNNNTN